MSANDQNEMRIRTGEAAVEPETDSHEGVLASSIRTPASTHARFSDNRRAWALLLGLSAIFIVSALWQPSDEPGLILCPFRALTGLRCPGCGMTHAFCAIAHGHLWRAIQYNPFSPLLFLASVLVWIYSAAALLRLDSIRHALSRLRPAQGVTWCLFALVMVWWVARLVVGI
ncbi:MAG TPA: DUF2752 domain-containing protein [Pyrinomonadaceae bacterium]|nr:DUF2752 domain-containing protein [Pyrinomonadaceae bacterium]